MYDTSRIFFPSSEFVKNFYPRITDDVFPHITDETVKKLYEDVSQEFSEASVEEIDNVVNGVGYGWKRKERTPDLFALISRSIQTDDISFAMEEEENFSTIKKLISRCYGYWEYEWDLVRIAEICNDILTHAKENNLSEEQIGYLEYLISYTGVDLQAEVERRAPKPAPAPQPARQRIVPSNAYIAKNTISGVDFLDTFTDHINNKNYQSYKLKENTYFYDNKQCLYSLIVSSVINNNYTELNQLIKTHCDTFLKEEVVKICDDIILNNSLNTEQIDGLNTLKEITNSQKTVKPMQRKQNKFMPSDDYPMPFVDISIDAAAKLFNTNYNKSYIDIVNDIQKTLSTNDRRLYLYALISKSVDTGDFDAINNLITTSCDAFLKEEVVKICDDINSRYSIYKMEVIQKQELDTLKQLAVSQQIVKPTIVEKAPAPIIHQTIQQPEQLKILPSSEYIVKVSRLPVSFVTSAISTYNNIFNGIDNIDNTVKNFREFGNIINYFFVYATIVKSLDIGNFDAISNFVATSSNDFKEKIAEICDDIKLQSHLLNDTQLQELDNLKQFANSKIELQPKTPQSSEQSNRPTAPPSSSVNQPSPQPSPQPLAQTQDQPQTTQPQPLEPVVNLTKKQLEKQKKLQEQHIKTITNLRAGDRKLTSNSFTSYEKALIAANKDRVTEEVNKQRDNALTKYNTFANGELKRLQESLADKSITSATKKEIKKQIKEMKKEMKETNKELKNTYKKGLEIKLKDYETRIKEDRMELYNKIQADKSSVPNNVPNNTTNTKQQKEAEVFRVAEMGKRILNELQKGREKDRERL